MRGLFTLLLVCAPAAIQAQTQQQHQVTLDASVLRGTVGYARAVAPAVSLGGELGFGFPQIDRTLLPSTPRVSGEADFREYLHVAAFVRQRVHRLVSYDAGVRASAMDVWPCTASDCWPGWFAGGYVQPMIGGRRLSIGPRLVAGWATEPEDGGVGGGSFVVAVAPLNVRVTLGW